MTENATSTDMNTPATSLTDKERELIAQMPYEEARDKLIQAVQALETGGLNLDQSMRQSGDSARPWLSAPRVCSTTSVPSSTKHKPSKPPTKPPQARSPTSTELPPGAASRGSHLSPDWTEFCFPAYDSGD